MNSGVRMPYDDRQRRGERNCTLAASNQAPIAPPSAAMNFPSCEVDRRRTLGGVKRIPRPNRHISDRLRPWSDSEKDCRFSAVRNVAYWPKADILVAGECPL